MQINDAKLPERFHKQSGLYLQHSLGEATAEPNSVNTERICSMCRERAILSCVKASEIKSDVPEIKYTLNFLGKPLQFGPAHGVGQYAKETAS